MLVAAQGIQVGARTGCPTWLGERLDVGWTLDVLHPRAARGVRAGENTSRARLEVADSSESPPTEVDST